MYTQGIERSAQDILMLIERGGLETFPDPWTYGQRNYMPATVRGVRVEAFIKDKNQDAILLECGTIEQRANIVLEPGIRRGKLYRIGASSRRRGAVMSVMIQVGGFKLIRMYRRKVLKQPNAEGHRIFKMAPLHHHFEKLGIAETAVVARFWIAGVLALVVGLIIYPYLSPFIPLVH